MVKNLPKPVTALKKKYNPYSNNSQKNVIAGKKYKLLQMI